MMVPESRKQQRAALIALADEMHNGDGGGLGVGAIGLNFYDSLLFFPPPPSARPLGFKCGSIKQWPAFTLGSGGTADSKQAPVGRLLVALRNKAEPLSSFLAGDHGGEESLGGGESSPPNGVRDKEYEPTCVCAFAALALTSSRLCKWCCGPMGPMAAPSPDPICSTSIWTLLSSRMPLVLARF